MHRDYTLGYPLGGDRSVEEARKEILDLQVCFLASCLLALNKTALQRAA